MQNEHQKRTTIARRIIVVAAIIVAIIAVGIGVALLLKTVSKNAGYQPPSKSATDQAVTPTAPSAASVISDYITPGNIQALSEGYQLQQNPSAASPITYKADGKTYTVSLTTSHYALFYATDSSARSDAQAIQDQTTSYMKEKGYQKIAQTASNLTTYGDLGAVCQLTSAPASTPTYYLIACADKSDVQKEYTTIEDRLALYKKSHQLDTFTSAISSTITAGNKSMTTISLTTAHQHPVLLFAAVDGNWSYIGNLGDGTAGTSNGKYTITPEIETAIHDPKYGDFLVHNLQ